jgi:hypothetical protein
MKAAIGAVLVTIALAGPAAAEGPSSAQLAKALAADGQAGQVRQVRCRGFGEDEPTEFVCRYQQRSKSGQWVSWSVYVAIDGDGWHLIDSPGREHAR